MRNNAKWNSQQRNLEVGEIVLIGDDHVPMANWPMGVVTEVFKGPDDVVRVATIRTATGIYKRNVRVLAPLPIAAEKQSEEAADNVETVEECTPRADTTQQYNLPKKNWKKTNPRKHQIIFGTDGYVPRGGENGVG